MTAIKLNKIEPQIVEVWNSDGLFAVVNEYEFNDIRIQIKATNEIGWYVLYNGERLDINKHGKLSRWPDGFFDTFEKQLDELI